MYEKKIEVAYEKIFFFKEFTENNNNFNLNNIRMYD